ncbi:MarR family winged helix-turn-helix transcriptional regulator [Microbacterium sp. MYb62]|uniref:MarR family winged helix-turn-helix transcriptional regulator n=1 Tax=Microbacterium sp. MYb62 TaxID=1848690 RepID=UPI000CFBB136|nr:MarR family transcriptional regulator [Microbacterium sp. MYb62]PRB14139.1 MarR family transcriptional regulator [Microbacterium sp. MYb62]
MSAPSGPVEAETDAERVLFDMVDGYDRAFEQAAEIQGFSAAQACILVRLHEPVGMRQLAEDVGCDASNITQLVSRLESRGLVEREPDPADGRARRVRRTRAGDEMNVAFTRDFEFARHAVARLDPGEREELTRLLRKALGSDV